MRTRQHYPGTVTLLAIGLALVTTPAAAFQITPAGRGGTPPNPNAVSAAEFVIDPSTLINLGFEWFMQGDENRNASVAVSFRKKGETAWKDALPLLRLKNERISQGAQLDVITPNMFAGSILDLEPATSYEARFELSDPDGVRGVNTHSVTVATRAEPVPYSGGRVYHVYPHLRPQLETREFTTLAEYSRATGQDSHSVLLDYDVFVKVPQLDARDIGSLQKLYKADDLDFRLRAGSAAVDRGVALPTVTNGYAGAAPDLGALELGTAPPHYGPRQQ